MLLLSVGVSFLVFCLLIIVFSRLFSLGWILTALISFLISGFVFWMLVCIGFEKFNSDILAAFVLLSCAEYCFFHVVNIGISSVRIRILHELQKNDQMLFLSDLRKVYDAQRLIQMRLERLLINKEIVFREGKYFVHPASRLLRVALLFQFLKNFILGKKNNPQPYLKVLNE